MTPVPRKRVPSVQTNNQLATLLTGYLGVLKIWAENGIYGSKAFTKFAALK
jgi:hypothetical protein